MRDSDAAVLAVRLLGRWTQLARQHLPLGAGCVCGAGLGGLKLGDIEQDLLAYLRERHGVESTSVAGLLGLMIAERKGQNAVLADIARTLDSFDELHRSGA